MKLHLALVFDTNRTAHFVNPTQICSIAATGGTIEHAGHVMPVIVIGLSNGQNIAVSNLGDSEDEAIENLIAQLEDNACETVIGAKPTERIQG